MSGPPPRIRHSALGAGLATVVFCLAAAGCGGSRPVRGGLTQRDVSTIEVAMVDITSQCQPEVAGIDVNAASLRRDVDALLRTYRIVRPDARLSFGILHTTVHHELEVAQTDLQETGCAPQQARRLAVATENH